MTYRGVNALAEAQFSLYKDKLVRNRGSWRNIDELELATLEWVTCFNTTRLHGALGDIPPVEHGEAHCAQLATTS